MNKNIKLNRTITGKILDYTFYSRWRSMLNRCKNKNVDCFKWYGGRGIKVCDRWSEYENFVLDMWKSYQYHLKKYGRKETTLDRINNDGNYCKENCRWATIKQQSKNKRYNNQYTIIK